ncbi:hypothetical protein [Pseudomonas sp. NPDC087817]|uniref:hypothetical protein n=1 Tax=Pseudomonas sp. NPDC087817 TaxID=3364451 RepID=UPI0037FE2E5B
MTVHSLVEDRHKLSLFDLKEGAELFAATPLRAYDQMGLDEDRLELIMKATRGREIPVPGGGALLDEDAVDAAT